MSFWSWGGWPWRARASPVRFLTAEGLLRLKAPSLRERDQIDAAALRRILRGDCLP